MARAAELLAGEYTLAITNVPYLGSGQQSELLKDFAKGHYKEAKADLATIFVERMLWWLGGLGAAAAVTPQNWLFLTRYEKLREKLLRRRTWNMLARLGPGAFETIGGEVVNVALLVISSPKPSQVAAMAGIDVTLGKTPRDKATLLLGESLPGLDEGQADGAVRLASQTSQLSNTMSRILIEPLVSTSTLSDFASYHNGVQTGDYPQFGRCFWEIGVAGGDWALQQSTTKSSGIGAGKEHVFLWESGGGAFIRFLKARFGGDSYGAWLRGLDVWGKRGISVSAMQELPVSLYTGTAFDNNVTVLVPEDEAQLSALWAYCISRQFAADVRIINPKLSVTDGAFVQVPFNLDHWQKVAAKQYPNGLPEPQSDDPTQWLFHGYPAKFAPATVLQVAVGRLLGYKWPPELDSEMRLSDEARKWVARCDTLKDFADEDGIVCLSALRGEVAAVDRLRRLLAAAFETNRSGAKEGGKPADSLEVWLRDRFFEEHCKLFHHRPFIWHIWDGNKDGFHCLVNGHKLTGPDGVGRRTLEAITFSYVGDWIARQKADQQEGTEGADARLAAAQDLQGQLEKILEGDPPYDLFVRWKPLHDQAIGWEPDINDGVRLNIRALLTSKWVEVQVGATRSYAIWAVTA